MKIPGQISAAINSLQLIRMGQGLDPDTEMGVFSAFRNYQRNEERTANKLRRAT